METAPQGPKVLRQALRKAFEATDDPIPRLRKWLRIVFGLRNRPFTDLFKLYPIISYRYLSLLAPARKTTSCSAPSGKSARQSSAATLSKTGRASRKTAPFHVLRHVFPPVFIVFSWFFHCFLMFSPHFLGRRLILGQPAEARQLLPEAPVVLRAQAAARRVQPAAQTQSSLARMRSKRYALNIDVYKNLMIYT